MAATITKSGRQLFLVRPCCQARLLCNLLAHTLPARPPEPRRPPSPAGSLPGIVDVAALNIAGLPFDSTSEVLLLLLLLLLLLPAQPHVLPRPENAPSGSPAVWTYAPTTTVPALGTLCMDPDVFRAAALLVIEDGELSS